MMDNCLSSNCETGGVGCDNMTMFVIALLHGKSKEEWYKEIADRVARGDGPCAPPEYGKFLPERQRKHRPLTKSSAEIRGPGARSRFRDSGEDDDDLDLDQRTRGIGGGRSGRIILLGDGTEILTDSDETEMFDHAEEDKDLDNQVSKRDTIKSTEQEERRTEREGTPAPESEANPEPTTPSSTTIDKSNNVESPAAIVKPAPNDTTLPSKLMTPDQSK